MESDGWFTTEWGHERRQRDAIESLEASVNGAYREASRLRSQLSSVQGSMQSKLDRLARAFDAFVELSDIRVDLAVHSDAALARHRVRLLLAAAAEGRTVVPPDLPEVPGYWLVPAARALYARLEGDRASAVKYTEAATELDAERARYFLVAAARLAGPVDLTAVELAALLPDGTRADVDRAGRAFWQATAAGAFGDAGRGVLTTALSGALGRPADGDAAALAPWLSATTGGPGTGSLRPGVAADLLATLRSRCEAAEPAPTADADRPTADADRPPAVPADPAVDTLAELIRSLVDEGHEPERELLRRSEKLRGLVETGTAPPTYRAWDEPVGHIGDLVRGDIFSAEASADARHIAVRAAVPWLRAVAEDIGRRVATTGSDTIQVRGRDVVVGPNGPDPASLADLRRARPEEQPRRTKLVVGLVTGAAGLVVAVGGFFVTALLGVLGIIVALVGVGIAVSARRANVELVQYARTERASIDRALEHGVEKVRRRQETERRDLERLDTERAALAELLS